MDELLKDDQQEGVIETEELTVDSESVDIDDQPVSDDESDEITSLTQIADWAKQLDPESAIDSDFLMDLSVTKTVNGVDEAVKISDLLASHQKMEASDQELSNARQQADQMRDEANQNKELWTRSVTEFGALVKELEDELSRDVQSTNWERLREDDPAEHAARKVELKERRERIASIKKKGGDEYAKAVSGQQALSQEKLNEFIQVEKTKLIDAVPELGDEAKGPALYKKIQESLIERGFTPQEISQVYDSRHGLLAYEAMMYRQTKGKSAAKKRAVKVPRVMKPGTGSTGQVQEPQSGETPASILYG